MPSRNEEHSYGGQALIEGVMMRRGNAMGLALRRANGEVRTLTLEAPRWSAAWAPLSWPVVRGFVSVLESLAYGVKALLISANEAAGEEDQLTPAGAWLIVGLSAALAVCLFMVLPTLAAGLLKRKLEVGHFGANLIEGLFRAAALIGYVWTISRVPDIARVLEYHGAEHKAINALEDGWTPDGIAPSDAMAYRKVHPRCGTSFLLGIAVMSAVVLSFFGWPSWPIRVALRLLLVPVISGISYEALKASSRIRSPRWRWVLAPGLWLQGLTTREPGLDQVEVALHAVRVCSLRREGLEDGRHAAESS